MPQILNEQPKLPFWLLPEVSCSPSPVPSQGQLGLSAMTVMTIIAPHEPSGDGAVGPSLPPSQNQRGGGFPALTSELNFLPFFICSSHLVDHPPLRYK